MANSMSHAELRCWYFEYLETCQSYRFDELGTYVHDDFILQGTQVGVAGFIKTLKTTLRKWPELQWVPRRIVIDMEQGPAICGWFDMFHNGKDGNRVHFEEVALYTMRDGKLAAIEVMFSGPVPEGGSHLQCRPKREDGGKMSKL